MTIDATSATTDAIPTPLTATLPATSATSLAPTQSEFLKLFVAQLQQQDPLNPASPSDMVGQLAQLTSVEQQAGVSAKLDALVAQQSSSAREALLGLFGRHVEAPADHVTIGASGGDLPVVANLPSAAKDVTVIVRDAAGQQIRSIDLGPQSAGACRLLDSADLPPGTYQLEVHATDASGAALAVSPTVSGDVSQISFADDGAHLHVAGLVIDPADVSSVS